MRAEMPVCFAPMLFEPVHEPHTFTGAGQGLDVLPDERLQVSTDTAGTIAT